MKSLSNNRILKDRLQYLAAESNQYFSDAERLLEFSQNTQLPVTVIQKQSSAWIRGPDEAHLELAFLSSEGRARLVRVFALCDEIITVNRIDLDRAQEDMNNVLQRTRRTAFILSALSILILLFIAAGFTLSMLYPLRDLMEGVRRVEHGRLDVEIPVSSSDEIGELTEAFNRATRLIRQQNEQLWRETITDGLTGVYNHRHFRKLLKQEVERSRRTGNVLSLMMVDIDFFKRYNDEFGHEFGNEVLKRVCQVVRDRVRETDMIARYGGDELAIILPHTTAEEARLLAERLVQAVSGVSLSMAEGRQPPPRISVSIGGASCPLDAAHAEDLIQKADEALYLAKQNGRAQAIWCGS